MFQCHAQDPLLLSVQSMLWSMLLETMQSGDELLTDRLASISELWKVQGSQRRPKPVMTMDSLHLEWTEMYEYEGPGLNLPWQLPIANVLHRILCSLAPNDAWHRDSEPGWLTSLLNAKDREWMSC